MFKFLSKVWDHHFSQAIIRVAPLLAFAAIVLVPDTGSSVVIYSLAISLLIAAASHLVRKLLFPYVDLSGMAEKAGETAVGAGIVFASVSFLLGVMILGTIFLLH